MNRRYVQIKEYLNKNKFLVVLRYLLALPISFFLFYLIGEILFTITNWTNNSILNKVTIFILTFCKNIILITSFYIIIPSLKFLLSSILVAVMIILNILTIYIYLMNLENNLAGVYITQLLTWIGIELFLYFKIKKLS